MVAQAKPIRRSRSLHDMRAVRAAAHPSAATTGIDPAAILAKATSNKITAGGIYANKIFTGTVTVNLPKGQSATFINCRFDAADGYWCIRTDGNLGTVTVTSCELTNCKASFHYGSNITIGSCYCHGSDADGFKPSANCVYSGNYITDIGRATNSHADGVQISGGTNIVVTGNTFDTPGHCNSNLFVQGVTSANITFSGNWCSGGNYAVHAFDSKQPGTISITGNTFVAGSQKFGVLSCMKGIIVSGNVDDGGNAISTRLRLKPDRRMAAIVAMKRRAA